MTRIMRVTAAWAVLSGVSFVSASGQDGVGVELYFLDVGQGDAAVIRAPSGHVALIDAGRSDITPMLEELGIDTIQLAVASHPHADHIGGMASVLRRLPVAFYLDNGVPHTTATYRELMRVLQASAITYLAATERTITLGNVRLHVMPPDPTGDSHNNRSVGILLEYGEFRALLTGDSEIPALNHWLEGIIPDVTVLKAAHHGSRDAVSPAWLAATRPEVVVVSCGVDNPYGHPHAWAMRYYEATATQVLRTDYQGTVAITGYQNGNYVVTTRRN